MTDWLIEQTILCSAFMLILINSRKYLNKQLGAFSTYLLWAVIPITLMVSLVFEMFPPQMPYEIYKAVYHASKAVTAKEPILTEYQSLWLFYTYFLGTTLVLFGLISSYAQSIKQLCRLSVNSNTLPMPFRHIQAYQSDLVPSPVIIGLFKLRIILPADFNSRYSDEQQQLIIEHELTHYRHKDNVWNLFALMIIALFWFNPIVWIAYKAFRQQQELACDQDVLKEKSLNQRKAYAYALLNTCSSQKLSFFTQLNYSDEMFMKERIVEVNQHIKNKKRPVLILLASLLAVGAIGQYTLAGQPESLPAAEYRVPPKYPLEAAQKHIEGYVQLTYTIEKSGEVSNVKVTKAEPENVFNANAINAIKQWKFEASDNRYTNIDVQLDFLLGEEKSADTPKFNGSEIIDVKGD